MAFKVFCEQSLHKILPSDKNSFFKDNILILSHYTQVQSLNITGTN